MFGDNRDVMELDTPKSGDWAGAGGMGRFVTLLCDGRIGNFFTELCRELRIDWEEELEIGWLISDFCDE